MNFSLEWDAAGQKFYETGVDRGVLYVMGTGETPVYGAGVAWNGLTAITEKPSGAEPNPQYADNIKYLNLLSAEEFAATIEAFTYPKEFAPCDGLAEASAGMIVGQQGRRTFGLSYRTKIGNDAAGLTAGYKIHIIYGALAAPSERAYATINDSPEAITFSWDVSTTPVSVSGLEPTAIVVLDSRTIAPAKMTTIEEKLYGTKTPTVVAPKLLMPDEIVTILAAA